MVTGQPLDAGQPAIGEVGALPCAQRLFLAEPAEACQGVALAGGRSGTGDACHGGHARRRAALEGLFTEHGLTPTWTLCPMTTDAAVAQEWLTSRTEVQVVEGLVIKGMGQRYLPGARGWFKVRRRETMEAIIGGITGTLRRPQLLVLGRYDQDGHLRVVGRTTSLKPDAAQQLADHLTAGPDHPWTGVRFTATGGSREPLDPILVVPGLVAEISADTAIDRGVWIHPLRFVRLRLDVPVADVPGFGEGVEPSSG